jgi:hypothetical protein
MLPVVLVNVTVPAFTAPLKLVLAEFVIVRLPALLNVAPAIAPVVPPFNVKEAVVPVTAPIVILLPAGRLPAVVLNRESPARLTLSKVIAAPLVLIVPFTITEDGLLALPAAATPFVKFIVLALPNDTEPAFRKLTASLMDVVLPSNETLKLFAVVVKLDANKLPLKATVLVEFDNVTATALTFPLKLAPAEFVIVKSPPVNEEPVIIPVVPPFNVNELFEPLVTAAIVMLLPAGVLPAVVLNVELPVNDTLPKSIAPPLVAMVPFTVVALAMEVTPFAKFVVPAKVTPPVLEKVAAFVMLPPAFNATL